MRPPAQRPVPGLPAFLFGFIGMRTGAQESYGSDYNEEIVLTQSPLRGIKKIRTIKH